MHRHLGGALSARVVSRAAVALMAALVGSPVLASAQSRIEELRHQIAALDEEIAQLEAIQGLIEDKGHLVLATRAGGALIDREQAASLYVTLTLQGVVTPDYAVEYARGLTAATRIYLNDYIKPGLEEARRSRATLMGMIGQAPTPTTPSASAPPGAAIWPAPMEWTRVRGEIRGRYLVQCAYEGDPLPPDLGTFRLDLLGNGSVSGTYENVSVQWPVSGAIDSGGIARGQGSRDSETFRWAIAFARSGDRLTMSSGSLQVTSQVSDVTCEPGSLFP